MNIEGIKNLYKACCKYNLSKFTYVSSNSPFGFNSDKKAFDEFINWVKNRRIDYPNLHVYHYASYEKTALGRLATNHGIHKTTWDQWLREELFIDLFPIVRNGLLLGERSYSIKK